MMKPLQKSSITLTNTLMVVLSMFLSTVVFAAMPIKGKVVAEDGTPIPGVSVIVKGTNNGTQTAVDGTFSLDVSGNETLVFSFVGYTTKEVKLNGQTNLNVVLEESIAFLTELVVTGSRSGGRTQTESPVPVDIINVQQLTTVAPQNNLNQILNVVAPSFTSNSTTVADGTDHIDPAQLRGLGPDQVLVLLNGKRRHTSSLVNVNGSPGRGSVGTDLNAIPAFAIDKIEVLRDGASAQYGSDAIAGIINVKMKEATGKLDVSLYGAGNLSSGSNNFDKGMDGETIQFDANYGFKILNKGFVNLTSSIQRREPTSRALPATGTIYSGYNAIEYSANAAGYNLNNLFTDVDAIKLYANAVSYFTPAQQSAISAATDITELRTALKFDVTEDELSRRGLSRSDFNMRVGQSSLRSTQFFLNSALPINDNIEIYAFGGYGKRKGNAAGFYRRPNQNRTYTPLYLNGFLPEIASEIVDLSFAAGIRGTLGTFRYDLSNTFGSNKFDYGVENTSNATMLGNSPTTFNAGGLEFSQNTTNLDLSRKFDVLAGMNLAFGAEYRYETYGINAGDENSYARYDINGNIITSTGQQPPVDFYGSARPGGSQVFPGFSPTNSRFNDEANRNSVAAYVDTELDVTNRFLLAAALRFENYSDFGSTLNYKLATRYKLSENINIRGAISSGFRAPSLAQKYFNSTATQFVGGVPFEVGTFANTSTPAKLLGIPNLKQEESQSFSAGFTAKVPQAKLSITVDGFFIKIKDRVTLTDQFSRPTGTSAEAVQLQQLFDQANATAATFFSNALDTETKGVDVVVSHRAKFANGFRFNTDIAGTYNKTQQVGDIKGSDILIQNGQINRYFSETSRVYLEESVPRFKANMSNLLLADKFEIFMRNIYFGKVTDPNTVDVNGDGFIGAIVVNGQAVENEHPVWGGRLITDFSVGYNFTKSVKLIVGANNIFDIYPDKNNGPVSAKRPSGVQDGNVVYNSAASTVDLSNSNQFVYSRNVGQFGMNGRLVFARLNLSF